MTTEIHDSPQFRDPTAEVNLGATATKLLKEEGSALKLKSDELPGDVRDAFADYSTAVVDLVGAGRQLEADRAELAARHDLIPHQGYRRLTAKATDDARTKLAESGRAADKAYKRLEATLADAAMPKLSESREALARDEARVALDGQDLEVAALDLATNGTREAVGALTSPWGSTYLQSRGVKNLEGLLGEVRRLAGAVASERGETARERVAGSALAKLRGLGAAGGTARAYVHHLTEGLGVNVS